MQWRLWGINGWINNSYFRVKIYDMKWHEKTIFFLKLCFNKIKYLNCCALRGKNMEKFLFSQWIFY
jgi:hypothetical protein